MAAFAYSNPSRSFVHSYSLVVSATVDWLLVDPAPHSSSSPGLRYTKRLFLQQGFTHLSLLSLLPIQLTPLWLHNQLSYLDYLIFFLAFIYDWVHKVAVILTENPNLPWHEILTLLDFLRAQKFVQGMSFVAQFEKEIFARDLAKIQNIFYVPIMWLQFYLKSSVL